MKLHLPDLHYACSHCGYSCQGLDVELSLPEAQGLLAIDEASVRRSEVPAALDEPLGSATPRFWLQKRSCNSCHFLDEQEGGRCELHRRLGAAAKPTACREFPFRAVQTPGGVFVGASFACQAIATSYGPMLSEAPDVRVLELSPYPLAPGLGFQWDQYLDWETSLLESLRANGSGALWKVPLELSLRLVGGAPRQPAPSMESELQAVFRGLLALAEGYKNSEELLAFLQAHAENGRYRSRLLQGEVDVAEVLRRWQEPWPLWPEALPFFEHLLFRKYLLEGPDVHSRLCSLPILAQILQFLVLARTPEEQSAGDLQWALRLLEERLTFHARGLERYLGRCGQAFLHGFDP